MDIREIKGIGDSKAALFEKLNIRTVEDLLHLYPRDYEILDEPIAIEKLDESHEGHVVAIDGVIAGAVQMYKAGRFTVVSVIIRDEAGDGIKCNWFNMPYLKANLRRGERFVFRGYLSAKRGTRVLEQPSMTRPDAYRAEIGVMQPKYPLTKGLSNAAVVKTVNAALEMLKSEVEEEYLPRDLRRRYELAEHNFAMRAIHHPKDFEEYKLARKRLSFEEFFLFVLSVKQLKAGNELRDNACPIKEDPRTRAFLEQLPYELTGAQKRTYEQIKRDCASEHLMNRLVQGDVGSGKTIVATLALMNAAFNGYQAAIMAPTEVLSCQEYEGMKLDFERYGVDISVELLTGSLTAKQKREAYERIRTGESQIICGTHALIQEAVEFHSLGLVITDEQHRFGVNQRKMLSDKGIEPHVLVMSATPIPRTLALILYGDLDISIMDELPAGRRPIRNAVVDHSYREKAYAFIRKQVAEGHQVYVICPMVEESEGMEAENVNDYSKTLAAALGPSVKVGKLHGKMKPLEKNKIMAAFARNEINVLVSTTVIEVGVNVPNATVMMVEDANRFGLAQLHQLRGRVGRGDAQSYCIFVTANKGKTAMERLNVLKNTNDGFKIAEEDLKLRGPGDFFGIRQSGDFSFGIADIYNDSDVLKEAAQAATDLLSMDPLLKLPEHAALKRHVDEASRKAAENVNL